MCSSSKWEAMIGEEEVLKRDFVYKGLTFEVTDYKHTDTIPHIKRKRFNIKKNLFLFLLSCIVVVVYVCMDYLRGIKCQSPESS